MTTYLQVNYNNYILIIISVFPVWTSSTVSKSFIISEPGSQDISIRLCRMQSILLLGLFIIKSLALEKEQDGPTICTLPTGSCYLGSQLGSDAGTQYYSFQGVRSVLSRYYCQQSQ